MTRKETAMANFYEGYNCAQSVVLAFADLLPMERDVLSRLSCSFGGGVGRLREVCGAVSGMALVLGLVYGYASPEVGDVKAAQYARVQECARALEARWGSIVCRELLGLEGHDSPIPAARTAEYYNGRPCAAIVGDAAEILEAYLEKEKPGCR